MEVNLIKIDDKDYLIIDTIEIDNNRYFLLANEQVQDDICLRKVIREDGKEYLTLLESQEELDNVMIKFTEKHLKKGEKNEK